MGGIVTLTWCIIFRPKSKDVCLPFSNRPKFLEIYDFFFFFDIQFCIFKHNCSKKIFKMHCNCPKRLLCRRRRFMCLPHTCLHQIVWCYLFKYRKLYDLLCISSISRLKKKDRPTDPPNFQAKRANKPLFLRPYLEDGGTLIKLSFAHFFQHPCSTPVVKLLHSDGHQFFHQMPDFCSGTWFR